MLVGIAIMIVGLWLKKEVGVIIDTVYGYYTEKSSSQVVVQNISAEVDLDAQSCTDGKKDCKNNLEFFDHTWLYTGPKNFVSTVVLPDTFTIEKKG